MICDSPAFSMVEIRMEVWQCESTVKLHVYLSIRLLFSFWGLVEKQRKLTGIRSLDNYLKNSAANHRIGDGAFM